MWQICREADQQQCLSAKDSSTHDMRIALFEDKPSAAFLFDIAALSRADGLDEAD
jgi:hypothetical protein